MYYKPSGRHEIKQFIDYRLGYIQRLITVHGVEEESDVT